MKKTNKIMALVLACLLYTSDQMSPSVSVSGTVKYGNESLTGTTISGVSEEYLELKKQDLTAGRFLQYSDLISRQKVCVIGYYLASELCGGAQNAIGETIHINGEGYTVVGLSLIHI